MSKHGLIFKNGSVLQGAHWGNIFRKLPIWSHGEQEDLSKKHPRRPQPVDQSGGLTTNSDVLYGLYYGTTPWLQFASPLAYTPVKVPSMLTGIPTPRAEDKPTQEALKAIIDQHSDDFQLITSTSVMQGTCWPWVRYSQEKQAILWDCVPDETISDIEISIDTGDIVGLWTHEIMAYNKGYMDRQFAERKRHITPQRIEVWLNDQGSGNEMSHTLENNPFGFMPIPFGHECRIGEWRGHSVFARILRLMKSTHEIHLNRDEILSKFKPKLVQSVDANNAGEWLKNNGYSGVDAVDPMQDDFFLNAGEAETTNFLYLQSDATAQLTAALEANRKEIIAGSGCPAIFWPSELLVGNYSSADTQTMLGVEYVKDLRHEEDKSYTQLFNQTLTIKGFLESRTYSAVKNGWDNFSMVSQATKAQIFSQFTQGLASIIQSASMGYSDIEFFIEKFWPEIEPRTKEQLMADMTEMLDHTAALNSPLSDISDVQSVGSEPEPAEPDAADAAGGSDENT
jgi:hypothetical protein